MNLDYVGDDRARLVFNQDLHGGRLWDVLAGQLADRPLTLFTFWIQHKIFGPSPTISRIINIFFHLLTAAMIAGFILRESKNRTLALYLAVLFFVHAINSQIVIVSIQRGTILAAFFSLLSLYLVHRGKTPLAVLSFLLGVLSKQLALVFAIPLCFFLIKKKEIRWIFPLIIFSLIPPFFFFVLKTDVNSNIHSPLEYFFFQIANAPLYLGKILYPFGLHYMYGLDTDEGFLLKFILGLVLVVGLLFFFILLVGRYNKKSWKYFFFLLLSVIPEFTFFSIPHLFFEHRLYLPFSFFLVFIGSLGSITSFGKKHHIFSISIILFFSWATLYRSLEVSTKEKWDKNILKYPTDDFVFHYEIAFESMMKKKKALSLEAVRRIEEHSYPNNANLYLLKHLYEYIYTNSSKENLEKTAQFMILNRNIFYHLRVFVNKYILEELPRHAEKEKRSYLSATLICPQVEEISFEEKDDSFIKAKRELLAVCILNANLFLENHKRDPKKEKVQGYLKRLKKKGLF